MTWSNEFPPTFDVGTPGAGHTHFDSTGIFFYNAVNQETFEVTAVHAKAIDPGSGHSVALDTSVAGNPGVRFNQGGDPATDGYLIGVGTAVQLTPPNPNNGSLPFLTLTARGAGGINQAFTLHTTPWAIHAEDDETSNPGTGFLDLLGPLSAAATGSYLRLDYDFGNALPRVTIGHDHLTEFNVLGPVKLTGQTFPNLLFAPSPAGTVSAQIIASTGNLNFDVVAGDTFLFRSGINGTAFLTITDTGSMQLGGVAAEYRAIDRDGIGGDYFSYYASAGQANIYSSVLGNNVFSVFENGNATVQGSLFTQSQTYGARLGAGNDSGVTADIQLAFGYHGVQDSYRHAIKTMHDGGTTVNNRLSIWLWTPASAPAADPTFKAAEFDGTGNLVLTGTLFTQQGSPSFAAVTTATSAAAGTATALPTLPAGYFVVTINGTNRKIPYYA